ncbi:response regulator [Magnetococcales bacterium HHB-1]
MSMSMQPQSRSLFEDRLAYLSSVPHQDCALNHTTEDLFSLLMKVPNVDSLEVVALLTELLSSCFDNIEAVELGAFVLHSIAEKEQKKLERHISFESGIRDSFDLHLSSFDEKSKSEIRQIPIASEGFKAILMLVGSKEVVSTLNSDVLALCPRVVEQNMQLKKELRETKAELNALKTQKREALKNFAEYIEQILSSYVDPIFIISPDGTIEEAYHNHLFGYQHDELIQSNIGTLFEEEFKSVGLRKLSKEGRLINFEASFRTKKGGYVPVLFSGSVLQDVYGNEKYILFLRDISNYKKSQKERIIAEERLRLSEHINRAKGLFFAKMSHEIRTPLNGLLGCAGLLKKSTLNEKQKIQLGTIVDSGEHLFQVVNDFLDYAKLEEDKVSLERIPFDLYELLMRTCALFNHRRSGAVEIELHKSPELPQYLVGDPKRLRQILFNLLSNAKKFTLKGCIKLRVEASPDQNAFSGRQGEKINIRFIVQDTGTGIPEEKVESLFSPYTQLDNSATRACGGTGLGLTIANQLALLMGSGIKVKSKPGVGSSFQFDVHFSKSSQKEKCGFHKEVSYAKEEIALLKGFRILVVDDERINRFFFKELLSSLKIEQVTEAVNGQHALDLIKSHAFDLIFLDCHMPILNGWQAAEAIRAWEKDEKKERLPVIALTADVSLEAKEQCVKAGFDDLLMKPFKEYELITYLKRWLLSSSEKSPTSSSVKHSNKERELSEYSQLEKLRAHCGAQRHDALLEMFLKEVPKKLDLLKEHIKENDCKKLRATAHAFKGICGISGALSMANICLQIEQLAEKEALSGGDVFVNNLEEEAKRFISSINLIRSPSSQEA